MTTRPANTVFTGVLASLVFLGSASVLAQSGSEYSVDNDWVELPDGMEWDGAATSSCSCAQHPTSVCSRRMVTS